MTQGPDLLTPLLAPLLAAAPLQAGVLITAIRDLALAVDWAELRPMALAGSEWVVVVGRKRKSDPLRAVLPLPLHTTALTPSQLAVIFRALAGVTLDALPPALPPLAPGLDELRRIKAARDAERRDAQGDDDGVQGGDEAEDPKNTDKPAPTDTLPQVHEFDPDTLYVAIGTTDSTVVYYKLSRGIKKPHDIPDE